MFPICRHRKLFIFIPLAIVLKKYIWEQTFSYTNKLQFCKMMTNENLKNLKLCQNLTVAKRSNTKKTL